MSTEVQSAAIETWALDQLRDSLRYQRAEGIHTYGDCSLGCGNPARGCGVCAWCLQCEMTRRERAENEETR